MTKYPLLFLTLIIFLAARAQKKSTPITFSVFNESTAIPFTKFVTTPVHPGVQLGTEFNYKVKKHVRLYQAASVNYFYHKHLAQGIGINTELGFEYRLKSDLAFGGLIGVGYLHTFATAREFSFINGQFEKRTDKGNARVCPSLSIDLSYYLKKKEHNSPKLFMRYQSWAEYPYSPGFIPVMTHISLHIGAKLFIHKKTFKK